MSWDSEQRDIKITSKKENKEKIIEIIKKLDLKKSLFKYHVHNDNDNNIYIDIEDYGAYKPGVFCSRNDYNFEQFIKDILDVDKENTTINVYNGGWAETDSYNYFYENGKIVSKSTKSIKFSELKDKQEKIAKIKSDFEYFTLLSEEERKDFDYQMASLEAPYPSYTWEFGSDDLDELYTDDFLDNEETVRAIFKFGGRGNLFNTRVPSKYKEDFELMSELLLIRPNYIEYLPNTIRENKDLILKLIAASKPKKNIELNEQEEPFNDSFSFLDDDYVIVPLEEDSNDFKFESECDVENSITMEDISSKLRNDKEIALKMIELDSRNFNDVSDSLKEDYDVCYKYISCGGNSLENINNLNILSDISIMREFIKKACDVRENLVKIPNLVKEDREFLINFFTTRDYKEKDSLALQEKFKNMEKKDIISYAILNDQYFHWYIDIIPKSLKYDKDIIKKIIEANKKEKWYESIPINFEILNDKDIMQMLKKEHIWYSINIDSDTTKEELIYYIKNNKISYDSYYEDINENLLNDDDVKKTILKYYKAQLCFFDFDNSADSFFDFLKKITDFNEEDLKLLFKNNGWLIEKFPKYLEDKEMMKIVLSSYPDAYEKMNEEFKNDKDLLNIFLNAYISVERFKWLPQKYQEDKETCLKIIANNADIYGSLNDQLKEDFDIAKIALKKIDNFKYASTTLLNTKELVKGALKKYNVFSKGTRYINLGDKLRDDEEFILELCYFGKERNRFKYLLASNRLLNDKNFISKVFNFDANLTLEEMYIKVLDYYGLLKKDFDTKEIFPLPIDKLNNVNILRHYLVKKKYLKKVNDYGECQTSAELICAVSKKKSSLTYEFHNILTDELMSNRDFVINLLKIKPLYRDSFMPESDRILKNFQNDEEIMKLYKIIHYNFSKQ